MNITDRLEHLQNERHELTSDIGSIAPGLSLAKKLRERLSAIDIEIRELTEKRASTIAYEAPESANTIPAMA